MAKFLLCHPAYLALKFTHGHRQSWTPEDTITLCISHSSIPTFLCCRRTLEVVPILTFLTPDCQTFRFFPFSCSKCHSFLFLQEFHWHPRMRPRWKSCRGRDLWSRRAHSAAVLDFVPESTLQLDKTSLSVFFFLGGGEGEE